MRIQTDQNRTDRSQTGPDQSDIRGAEASKKKKNEDPSGSIRDITARLIKAKNTSIAETCIVFNGKSAGNNPRWIYWSYEFFFFRPLGLRTRRPAGEDPDVKIRRSKGLTP